MAATEEPILSRIDRLDNMVSAPTIFSGFILLSFIFMIINMVMQFFFEEYNCVSNILLTFFKHTFAHTVGIHACRIKR